MNSKKALAVFALFLVLMILAGRFLIEKRKKELLSYPTVKERSVPVEFARVREGFLRKRLRYVGRVYPEQFATVSTKLSGVILEVTKREGEEFKKGDILVRIDDSELRESILSIKREREAKEALLSGFEAQLRAAEIERENAKKQYERELFLFERGAVPKESVEKLQNAYKGAEAKVESLKSRIKSLKLSIKALERKEESLRSSLKYTTVRALKDGVVSRVLAYPGTVVLPGKPIMEVFYPQDGMKILVNVPPAESEEVVVGGEAKVEGKVEGVVSKVYPASEKRGGLFVIEIKLKRGAPFKPYQFVRVELLSKAVHGLIVPASAILRLRDGDFVLVLRERDVKAERVEVLERTEDYCVVSGNIHPGEKVVVGRENRLLRIYRLGKAYPAEEFNG